MLNVTDSAVAAIRGARTDPAQALRIMVVSGGCSGLQYRMGLDTETHDDDQILEFGEIRVLLDPGSAMWLTGARMDYVDGASGPGFVFDNPNAGGKCSCAK